MAETGRGAPPAQRWFGAPLWHPPALEKVVPVEKVAPTAPRPPRWAKVQEPSVAGVVLGQGCPGNPSVWEGKGDC